MSFSFINKISLYLSFIFIISCQDTISSLRNDGNIITDDYNFQFEGEELFDFSFFENIENKVIDIYTSQPSDYNFIAKKLHKLKIKN